MIDIYRNRKHGGLYLLHNVVWDRTNDRKPKEMAYYQSLYNGCFHVRDWEEFQERFNRLTPDESCQLFASRELRQARKLPLSELTDAAVQTSANAVQFVETRFGPMPYVGDEDAEDKALYQAALAAITP